MALDRKSVHIRLAPELHERLSLMADFYERDQAELAAQLLEKMIVAEFHSFSIAAERYSRLGLTAAESFSKGTGGSGKR